MINVAVLTNVYFHCFERRSYSCSPSCFVVDRTPTYRHFNLFQFLPTIMNTWKYKGRIWFASPNLPSATGWMNSIDGKSLGSFHPVSIENKFLHFTSKSTRCPALRAIRFHGCKEEREALSEEYFTNEAAAHDGRRPTNQIVNEKGELEDDNSDNPRAWDVCVTTYEVANTEKKALGRFAWKYLVIDEAHRLKNEASMFSTVRLGTFYHIFEKYSIETATNNSHLFLDRLLGISIQNIAFS